MGKVKFAWLFNVQKWKIICDVLIILHVYINISTNTHVKSTLNKKKRELTMKITTHLNAKI